MSHSDKGDACASGDRYQRPCILTHAPPHHRSRPGLRPMINPAPAYKLRPGPDAGQNSVRGRAACATGRRAAKVRRSDWPPAFGASNAIEKGVAQLHKGRRPGQAQSERSAAEDASHWAGNRFPASSARRKCLWPAQIIPCSCCLPSTPQSLSAVSKCLRQRKERRVLARKVKPGRLCVIYRAVTNFGRRS